MDQNDICEDILVALRQITRAIDLYSKKLNQSYGLTGPQVIVLKEIYKVQEISLSKLSQNVSLSIATVSSILDRLSKKGYVAKQKSVTDKRVAYITITDRGKEISINTPPVLQDNFMIQLHNMATWEQTQMLATLQRIACMMKVESIASSSLA